MKHYYIMRGPFSNVYALRYTETPEQEAEATRAGYERITRKEAEALARRERKRRTNNPSFAGYADAQIWPLD